MVASMSFFSVSLNTTNTVQISMTKRRETQIFDYASAYTMYILNILTNQGKFVVVISKQSLRTNFSKQSAISRKVPTVAHNRYQTVFIL